MQREHTSSAGGNASLTRRNFITIAAAGSVATLPAVALVEAGQPLVSPPRPQSQPEERVEACIAQLRNLLAEMHPNAKIHPHFLASRPDGSFRFSLQGDVLFSQYSGEGIYEVSIEGYPHNFWLQEDHEISALTGERSPNVFYWSASVEDDGTFKAENIRRMYSPRIIRKIADFNLAEEGGEV